MFRNILLKILSESWPMILICLIIIVSMRIIYIYKNKEKIIFYKEILKLCFIVYIMCLFYVVTFQDVSWSTSNFVPFKEMFRYKVGTKLFYKNVVGNTIMFIPLGFFTSYFLKLKKLYSISLFSLLISFTIEFTQLKIGRVFDIDDILLNIFGGILGFIIYYIIYNVKDKLPKLLKKDYIYNILIIVALVIGIIYLRG